MNKLFVVICGLMISMIVNADDNWIPIGQSNEQKYYLNYGSVKEVKQSFSANYVEAWIKTVIYNDLTKDGMSVNDYSMLRYRFDCEEKKLGNMFGQDYKQNGKPLGKSYGNSYGGLNYAIPDSVGENILLHTCLANEIKQGRINPEDFE